MNHVDTGGVRDLFDVYETPEYVTKSLAICMICGNPALRNQRTTEQGGQIVVGGAETYEARCRRCFKPVKDDADLFGEALEEG